MPPPITITSAVFIATPGSAPCAASSISGASASAQWYVVLRAAGRHLVLASKESYLRRMQREPLPQYATDDQIETLVATFYARIRRDEVLGPIFLAAIGE